MGNEKAIAPGAKVVIRDAEWLVRKVDRTSTGGWALSVIGITELVKDKEAIFLDDIEKDIQVLDPVDTKLVPDSSSSYRKSLLYMESLLRQTPPTDENLYIGYKAAMDPVRYTPYILYLVNQSSNTKIKGDMRILELLIKKDDEAVKNIGDPSALMGVYDIEAEEKTTADAIEEGRNEADFEEPLSNKAQNSFDPLKLLMGEVQVPSGKESSEKMKSMPTLYADDYQYLKNVDYNGFGGVGLICLHCQKCVYVKSVSYVMGDLPGHCRTFQMPFLTY